MAHKKPQFYNAVLKKSEQEEEKKSNRCVKEKTVLGKGSVFFFWVINIGK